MSISAFTVCCLGLQLYSVWSRCGSDNFSKIRSACAGSTKFNAQGEEEVSI